MRAYQYRQYIATKGRKSSPIVILMRFKRPPSRAACFFFHVFYFFQYTTDNLIENNNNLVCLSCTGIHVCAFFVKKRFKKRNGGKCTPIRLDQIVVKFQTFFFHLKLLCIGLISLNQPILHSYIHIPMTELALTCNFAQTRQIVNE